jgi:hypothetical protein
MGAALPSWSFPGGLFFVPNPVFYPYPTLKLLAFKSLGCPCRGHILHFRFSTLFSTGLLECRCFARGTGTAGNYWHIPPMMPIRPPYPCTLLYLYLRVITSGNLSPLGIPGTNTLRRRLRQPTNHSTWKNLCQESTAELLSPLGIPGTNTLRRRLRQPANHSTLKHFCQESTAVNLN